MRTSPGLGQLFALNLRLNRRAIALWTVGNSILFVSQGWSVDRLYATQREFDAAAATMADNPAFIALAGPARALNTTGGQVAWQASAFGAIVAAMMSMQLVVRHTRAEEEGGRDELVRAGAVGRDTPTLAATAAMVIANIIMGTAITASLVAYGLPWPGSAALGVGTAACGILFGAVALVAAQLFTTARAAYALTGACVAASYALRAIGDITGGGLSWASPIGWAQAMLAYADERWWPVGLFALSAVALTAIAGILFAARDAGTGVLTTGRPGPAHASRMVQGPLGLAWRLERNTIAGWAVGLFLGGLAYGSVGDDVKDVMGSSELSRDLFGTGAPDVVDAFYATAALILALVCCGFAIVATLRPGTDEASGIAEQMLATRLSRWRWGASTLAVALSGSVLLIVAAGIGLGAGLAVATGEASYLPSMAGATILQGAGVLLVACAAWLAYGIGRAGRPWAWSFLTYVIVVGLFTDVLGLPRWATALSPFAYLPSVPAEDFAVVPVVAVLSVGVGLGIAGLQALRRRDIG